jgi:hypothetical protein
MKTVVDRRRSSRRSHPAVWSVIVPVVPVCRMAMTVVYVVGVVTVRDRDVAAVRPVSVDVPVMDQVRAALALVGVPFVAAMEVTVVDVVDVISVAEGHVATARPMVMSVIGMDVVHSRHGLHVLVLQARDAVPAAGVFSGRSAMRPWRPTFDSRR